MLIICPDCTTRYVVDATAFDQGGRAVRCSHCGCEWYQIGPPDEQDDALETDGRAVAMRSVEFLDGDPSHRAQLAAAFDDGVQTHLEQGFGGRRRPPARPGWRDGPVDDVEIRASSGGRRSGLGGRTAVFLATALAIQIPIGAYYLGPQIGEAAPASAAALASYRSGVDLAFAWAGRQLGAEAVGGVVFVDYGYDMIENQDGRALLVWGRLANSGEAKASTPEIEIVTRDEDGKPLQSWRARAEAEELEPGESVRFASRMMFPLGPVRDVDIYFVK